MSQITITIKGPPKSGKTTVALLIRAALQKAGVPATVTDTGIQVYGPVSRKRATKQISSWARKPGVVIDTVSVDPVVGALIVKASKKVAKDLARKAANREWERIWGKPGRVVKKEHATTKPKQKGSRPRIGPHTH